MRKTVFLFKKAALLLCALCALRFAACQMDPDGPGAKDGGGYENGDEENGEGNENGEDGEGGENGEDGGNGGDGGGGVDGGEGGNEGNGYSPPLPVVHSPPALTAPPSVSYDPVTFAPSVTFAFDRAAAGSAPGWIIAGDGAAALTATPAPETELTPGILHTLALTAKNALDETKTAPVEATIMPVSGPFVRPDGGESEYALFWYDAETGAAGLFPDGNTETPAGLLVNDHALRNIFNAVYAPNAPGTADGIEPGKMAAAYTPQVSQTVLALFKIAVGPAPDEDRLEIAGQTLPAAGAGIDKYHPVVIDLGLPGTPNSGLPVFHIRSGSLGTPGAAYDHIRLRVNQGARLVIEADNSGYTAGGTGACPYGSLRGGTVEVTGGGRLRNGAYRGFPLGKDSIIIVRLGALFATGPESSFGSSAPGYDAEKDAPFEGWLIGSAGDDARICWGAGDQNGSYIEIRDGGTLAFDVNVTLRKTLALRYNVWFVNSPTLTIDAAGDSLKIGGQKGLVAENGAFKLYGTYFQTGGQNPARPAAKIVVMPGSAVSRSALGADGDGFVVAENSVITASNRGNGGGTEKADYGRDSIAGWADWDLPQ